MQRLAKYQRRRQILLCASESRIVHTKANKIRRCIDRQSANVIAS
jgi:hypothetical protein